MPFPQSSPYGGGSPSGPPLNLSPSVGSDGPRHYAAGYISTASSNQHQNFNNFGADSTADQDDWIPSAAINGRLRGSGSGSGSKSTYRGSGGGGLFAPKEINTPLRNSRNSGLFGSSTKLAQSVKSKRLSDALEDDAPPKESLFDDDLGQSKSRHDPSAHRTLGSSLSTSQTYQPELPSSSSTNDLNSQTGSTGYRVFVFGFAQSQQAFVLKHFTSIGDLLQSPEPSVDGGNWVTLTYKHAWAAQRAIRKNGEVLGGVIMIGCKAADDQSIPPETSSTDSISRSSSNMILSRPVKTYEAHEGVFATPTQARELGLKGFINSAGKPNPAIFQNSVEGKSEGSDTYLNRALDLIFGW